MVDVDVLRNKLKLKVSNNFLKLICNLQKGKPIDLKYTLKAISAINYFDQINVLQYYLNHE